MGKLTDLWTRITATRATNLDELGAANLPADIDNLKKLTNGIYFDSALGSSGTAWPKGEPQDPSSTIADVITMCAARKTKYIYGSGQLALGATMQDYTFIGINKGWLINLNGQDISGSHFINCSISGAQGGSSVAYFYDSYISSITSAYAFFYNCRIIELYQRAAKTSFFIGCSGRGSAGGATHALIDFGSAGTAATIKATGCSGLWQVKNMTDATDYCEIGNIDGGAIDSDVSNTAGTVVATGNARFTAGGGGATETDNTIWSRIGAPAGASVSADIAAAKTVIDTLALEATLTAIKGAGWSTETLVAIATAIAAIPTTAMRGTDNALLAASYTAPDNTNIANIHDVVKSGGTGDNAAIKAKTDKITNAVHRIIFKSADSAMLASLAFSNVAADKDFPSVVTTAKPTGATITKAYWGFSYSKKVDSSDGANAVSAAGKAVRVKVSTGSWGTDDIVAYTFANGALSTPASATEGGLLIMGSVDIKSVVDGSAATFNFRSEETERSDALTVTGASLTFYDVESWLVIEYTL